MPTKTERDLADQLTAAAAENTKLRTAHAQMLRLAVEYPDLSRLLGHLDTLAEAAHPLRSSPSDTPKARSAERAHEGDATAWVRRRQAAVANRLSAITNDIDRWLDGKQVVDSGKPGTGRCRNAACDRYGKSGRFGAVGCDRCLTPYEEVAA